MTLEETIKNSAESIRQNRETYERSEATTCLHLIIPILNALGWLNNTIFQNERTNDGFPDYTLKKDGNKKLLIEAKALHKPLDGEPVRQLGRYLQSEGVSYGLLTDGARYVLYRTFTEGTPFAQNKIWDINLVSDDISVIVSRLMMLSHPKIENLEDHWKKIQEMEDVWKEMIERKDDLIMVITRQFKVNLNHMNPDRQYDQIMIDNFMKGKVNELLEGNTHPNEIEIPHEIEEGLKKGNTAIRTDLTKTSRSQKRIPDRMMIGSDLIEINHTYDVLVKSANWLIKKAKLQCPIYAGRRRFIVNRQDRHPNGNPMRAPKKLSNGWYIETHYGIDATIANTQKIFRESGVKIDITYEY